MAKIIINIRDDIKSNTGSCTEEIYSAIQNGVLLPTNATNGDVIKALLNLKDEDIKAKNSCITCDIIEYIVDTDIYFLRFDGNWWNAPYEG